MLKPMALQAQNLTRSLVHSESDGRRVLFRGNYGSASLAHRVCVHVNPLQVRSNHGYKNLKREKGFNWLRRSHTLRLTHLGNSVCSASCYVAGNSRSHQMAARATRRQQGYCMGMVPNAWVVWNVRSAGGRTSSLADRCSGRLGTKFQALHDGS